MLYTLALSALLAANMASASAPIVVDGCSFIKSGSFEHAVDIRYHNASSKTATSVTFDVHNGQHAVIVSDHGTFAPGAHINHTLATPTWELHHAEPDLCAVTRVRFTDGSTWQR
jgi:hypothetical protein